MNWKILIFKFLRNVVVGLILGVVILSAFGYLLAGTDGMVNLAYWGFVLGLIGGFYSGLGMIFAAEFWGGNGNYKMFPEWNWFIRESDDKDQKSND